MESLIFRKFFQLHVIKSLWSSAFSTDFARTVDNRDVIQSQLALKTLCYIHPSAWLRKTMAFLEHSNFVFMYVSYSTMAKEVLFPIA